MIVTQAAATHAPALSRSGPGGQALAVAKQWPCSCDIFQDHFTFSFLKCAKCGVKKQDHFSPEEIGLRPCSETHEGWLNIQKANTSKLSMSDYKRRYARLRGILFEWAHDPLQADPDKR